MKLVTLAQAAVLHPAFTVEKLRWQLHCRNTSGLSSAVVKIGRRVYLDSDAFNDWIENQREN